MTTPHRLRPIDVQLPAHGVFVLESHHAPGFQMSQQAHDFLEIFYVLSGRGSFTVDGKRHPCHRGDLMVVPVGSTHRIDDHPEKPLALYGLCVSPAVWRCEPNLTQHLAAGRVQASRLLSRQVWIDLRRLLFEQNSGRPGSRAMVHGLTLRLLGMLARGRGPGETGNQEPSSAPNRQAVERYVAELPHTFFEATNLDDAAAELGMSRRRFTALFREATGSTWSHYVNRLRIDYACQLLKETNRSVIATAFESGFEDLSSFYRAFKRETGLPPKAWRERPARS